MKLILKKIPVILTQLYLFHITNFTPENLPVNLSILIDIRCKFGFGLRIKRDIKREAEILREKLRELREKWRKLGKT